MVSNCTQIPVIETGSIGNHPVNAMAPRDARSRTKSCTKTSGLNFLVIRSRFAAALFARPLLYLAGLIVLSGSLGVGAPALAQTAPYLNANGWTVFTPTTGTGSCGNSSSNYTGTCIIYVDNTSGQGNDSTCAAQAPPLTTTPTAQQQCATLSKAISLLRGGPGGVSNDWILLKAGDTFVGQSFGNICHGGISAAQPLLIGTYGTGALPLVEVPDGGNGGIQGAGCAGSGADNYIAVVGIEFYAYTRDPSSPSYNPNAADTTGADFLDPLNYLLIENCKFSFFSINIIVDGSLNGSNNPGPVTIRRNVIVDAYATDEHSQGIYVNWTNNLLVQENVLDNNGWNATVSGAGATVFNHNLYLTTENGPVTIVGNISSNGSSGSQFRSGGTITDNAFIRDPYGHNIGQPYNGVQTLVNNNVHIEQMDNTVNGGAVVSTDTIYFLELSGLALILERRHTRATSSFIAAPLTPMAAASILTPLKSTVFFLTISPATGCRTVARRLAC